MTPQCKTLCREEWVECRIPDNKMCMTQTLKLIKHKFINQKDISHITASHL